MRHWDRTEKSHWGHCILHSPSLPALPSLTPHLSPGNTHISHQERGAVPQPFPSPSVLTMGLAGAGCCHAEPSGAHAVAGHVLLRLEEDDVELGGEEAAEDHSAAEAHRDAHGGGLDLETGVGIRCPKQGRMKPVLWHWPALLGTGCTLQGHPTPHHILLVRVILPESHGQSVDTHGDKLPLQSRYTLSSNPSPDNMLLCGTTWGQSLHSPTPVPTLSGGAGPLWKPLIAAVPTSSSRPITNVFGCLC